MKRSQPKRDWEAARKKCDEEMHCRACQTPGGVYGARLEAAHIIGRHLDKPEAALSVSKRLWVDPIRIVPLCRQVDGGCHAKYDAHELDLLPYLTVEEQAQAVLDAGGLELARNRICGGRDV